MNLKIKNIFLDAAIAVLVVLIGVVSLNLLQSDGQRSGDVEFPADALALEIDALKERLARNGDDVYDWMDLASLYKLRGDHQSAIEALERALAMPDLIPEQRYALMVRLSELQLDAGRLDEAWQSASAASTMNPDRAPAFNRRGDVRYTEGRPIAALNEYETAGRVEPGDAESYALRAGILQERGDAEGAARVLADGVKQSDAQNQASAQLNLGRYFLEQGQTERAIAAFETAARLDRNDPRIQAALGAAHAKRAAALRSRGQTRAADRATRSAIAAYEKAARLDPRNAAVHAALGDLYAANGQRERAHQSYRAALGYDTNNAALRKKYLATRPSQDIQMAVGEDGAIVIAGGPDGNPGDSTDGATASGNGEANDSVLVQTTDAQGRPVTAALSNLYGSSSPGASQADAAKLKQKGRELYLKQKYALALTEFNRAADLAPKDAEARYLAGRTYAQLGRRDAAGEAYDQAIRLAPKDYRPHYHLGELNYRYRRYGDAAKSFQNALKAKPDLHTARYNLALSQTKSKQTSAAVRTYRELLRRDPGRWQAALNLAILLKQKNDTKGALQVLDRYTKSHPKRAALHYQKGEIHTKRGEIQPAINSFARTVQIEPKHFQAHFNTGVLYSRKGDQRRALQAYNEARKINDRDPDLFYAIGRLQKQSGASAPAIAALERALNLKSGHADAAIELIPLYLKQGRKLDAIAVMQRATRSNSRDYRLQFNAGNLYRKLGEHESARQAYQRAIQLKPGRADAYLNLALSFRDTREIPAAVSTYRSLLATQPNHPGAHEQLGLLLWQHGGDRAVARKHLKQYLELRPAAGNAGDIKRLLAEG